MSLSTAFLDELRERTLLSAVISPSVKLIRAGREWKACCPFHNEKTPSFTINDEKGFYHCFGCGAHGDAIRFLTDARGLPFMDAVKELAGKAGLEVPAADPQARERAERTSTLTDVMAACQKWFAEQLAGIEGAEARDYLKKRGIDHATVARFGIGLAPEGRNRLKAALSSLGEDKLVETGMLIKNDEGETYDRFRGRIMIPIRDARGRVIAFGGRILGAGEPKYLNSPDTPLFDKGRTLYNLDLASPASRSAKRLIVVEGYMDVIALDRAGISEAIAPNGTSITEAQLELMWRLDPAPILCLDGDTAGQKAAIRAVSRALPLVGADRTLRFTVLPAGQDPDDLIQSGAVAILQNLLWNPLSLHEWVWRFETSGKEFRTPEDRAALQHRLAGYTQLVRDPTLRRQYESGFKNLFWERFGWKKRELKVIQDSIRDTRPAGTNHVTADYALKRAVLLGLSRYPSVLRDELEAVGELSIAHRKLATWREVLVEAVSKRHDLDADAIEAILESSEASPIEKRDLQKDLAFSFFRRMAAPEKAKADLTHVIRILRAEAEVARALSDLKERMQSEGYEQLWMQEADLKQQRQTVLMEMSEIAALAS